MFDVANGYSMLDCTLDGEYVTGVQLESIVGGKSESERDDNSGAMRVKAPQR